MQSFGTSNSYLASTSFLKFLYVTACTVIALLFVQAPGGLYSEGRFNGGFFALRVWGAYIWRGLFSEVYGMFLN